MAEEGVSKVDDGVAALAKAMHGAIRDSVSKDMEIDGVLQALSMVIGFTLAAGVKPEGREEVGALLMRHAVQHSHFLDAMDEDGAAP